VTRATLCILYPDLGHLSSKQDILSPIACCGGSSTRFLRVVCSSGVVAIYIVASVSLGAIGVFQMDIRCLKASCGACCFIIYIVILA
jgi:hypothetical protein